MNHPRIIRVIQARECSKVERCHTLPHHGSYTNGQHSHDAVSLYLILCPRPKVDVIKAIHLHDYGERWVGDFPAPAKWAAPDLGSITHELEDRCIRLMGFEIHLDEDDRAWLKAIDSLELWLWAHDQVAMGNANAQSVIGNLDDYLRYANWLPQPVVQFMKDYRWERTSDLIPGDDR